MIEKLENHKAKYNKDIQIEAKQSKCCNKLLIIWWWGNRIWQYYCLVNTLHIKKNQLQKKKKLIC